MWTRKCAVTVYMVPAVRTRSCSVLAAQAVATVDGLTGDLDGGGKGVLCTEGDLLLQVSDGLHLHAI